MRVIFNDSEFKCIFPVDCDIHKIIRSRFFLDLIDHWHTMYFVSEDTCITLADDICIMFYF